MKLDTRLTSSALTLALAAVVILFIMDWQLPLLNGVVVRLIEKRQALWLLFGGAIYRLGIYGHFPVPKGQSSFGYGLLVWWVVLLAEAPAGA